MHKSNHESNQHQHIHHPLTFHTTASAVTMLFTAVAASLLALSPLASATTDCTWRYDNKRNFNYYYLSTDFGGKVPANFCKDVWHQFDPNNAEGYCTRTVDTKCIVSNGVASMFFWVAVECQNSKIENGLSLFLPPKEAVCTQVKTCPV